MKFLMVLKSKESYEIILKSATLQQKKVFKALGGFGPLIKNSPQ